nr:hypothetical protein BAR15_130118 [Bartonella sp. AR 15-3]
MIGKQSFFLLNYRRLKNDFFIFNNGKHIKLENVDTFVDETIITETSIIKL